MIERAVRTTTLDNGLTIVSDVVKSVETVSLGVWVDAGARHEPVKLNGVSHLLEHMTFKGTTKRSALDIATSVEDVGGHLNAYTSRENTAYYAKMLKEDMALGLDVVADIAQNAVIDDDELTRERTVIVQEINQAFDTPDDIVFDSFQEKAYPDQAIGRPVLGPSEGVMSMARDEIVDYMKTHYVPSNMILAAVGNLDHDRLVDLAEKTFGSKKVAKPAPFEKAKYVGGDVRESRDIEQLHVVLGFDGMTYHDPDFYAGSVFSTLFGGGMSSRLFQEIREKRGLVYSVYSFLSFFEDTGMMGIYAGTGPKEIGELIPVLMEEIAKSRDGVTAEELERSRAQLKASILMGLESTSSRCEQLARQMLVYGRPIPIDEIVAGVDSVTLEDVKRAAIRLTSSEPTLAALGPIDKLESFEAIKARL